MRNLTIALILFCVGTAQASQPAFREPSPDVTNLLTAPPPPVPLVHSGAGLIALLQEEHVIDMDRLLSPRLGLAGFRFDPVTRISGIEPLIMHVDLVSTRESLQLQSRRWLPDENARFSEVEFSPDGRYLSALSVKTGRPTQLWVYDIGASEARLITDRINPGWGDTCQWISNRELLCQMEITDRLPERGTMPIILEHEGKPLPTRTYSNLLETPADDVLFKHYFSSTLATIDIDGKITILPITKGVISHVSPAPDGDHILLRRIVEPYPRLVQASRFPSVVEVWQRSSGNRLYQSPPMGFGIEMNLLDQADPTSITWAPSLPVTAGFVFRLDKGNDQPEYQWRILKAPYNQPPEILASSATPIREFGWTSANTPWFIVNSETDKSVDIKVILPSGLITLWSGNRSNRYQNPGQAIRRNGSSGAVLEVDGEIFISGSGLTEAGPHPYLDRVNLETLDKRRLFTAEPAVYESVLAVLDPTAESLLTSRQTETHAPVFNIIENGNARTLYAPPDPYPQLKNVVRKRITYPRPDGVNLSATLYLPERKNNNSLPTLIWIYPREYSDPEQVEQLDDKLFEYHSIKGPSPIAAVLAGYAVLINPTVPIISDEDPENDQYLPQLVDSVEAAVDYLVSTGISDPQRIAVGGRSYGAFSAANLLIHSDRFASGIAMSGAYNRTLTPFGFQHEKRTFWQAADYYASISPFFHANKIKQPLLLVHGGEDPNPGTPKIQARRFFHALTGAGATVRYVELPGEEHHYRGRDTVLLATQEMIDWLDRTIGPSPNK